MNTPLGFANYKANCWANAVLQSLISIPDDKLKLNKDDEVSTAFKSLKDFVNTASVANTDEDEDEAVDDFLRERLGTPPPTIDDFETFLNDDYENHSEIDFDEFITENLPKVEDIEDNVSDKVSDNISSDTEVSYNVPNIDFDFKNDIDYENYNKCDKLDKMYLALNRDKPIYYNPYRNASELHDKGKSHVKFSDEYEIIENRKRFKESQKYLTDKNIDFLKVFIKSLNSTNFGNSQEDVTEFLYLFIDKLNLDECFRLYYDIKGFCSSCMGECYNSKDIMCIFNNTSEIYSKNNNLENIIEKNANDNDDYLCEKCNKRAKLIQQNTLTSAGDCLIVGHFKDLKQKKEIPQYLTILGKNYKLVAAIYHYGSINSIEQYKQNSYMNFGHYYAKCIRNGICYKFDDGSVELDSFLTNTENIYLTIYNTFCEKD